MKNQIANKRFILMSTVACVSMICSSHAAHAFNYQFDNGVDVRFDNTIEYSVVERTAPVNPYYGNNPNTNDTENALRGGIVSNRIDVLSLFNVSKDGYGFDATFNSFYDSVYTSKTQNRSGATYNPASTPADKFSEGTVAQAGRNIELENLYVYGHGSFAGVPFYVHVGRLTNLFGESLLFAGNGISYGQAPLNGTLAASVPNTPARDLFLPIGQAVITAQLTDSISATAYYQFEWQPTLLPPNGDFFEPADIIGAGGQRIYAASIVPYVNAANPGAAAYIYRANDLRGSDTGQFGLGVHYDPLGTPWDFGFYALQYNDHLPESVLEPSATPRPVAGTAPGSPAAVSVGTYQLVYANHIQIYGASFSTTAGPISIAGEASVRANEDLESSVTLKPGQVASNGAGAQYAIGNVAHYQVNEMYTGPKTQLWDSSSLIGEMGGENLFAISANKDNFSPTAKNMAFGLRTVASATYYEVRPGLDLTPSIGFGWDFMGNSPDTAAFNGTGDRSGDLTFGIGATYLGNWTGGIDYTYYIGPPARQVDNDRDFVSFNVERTF